MYLASMDNICAQIMTGGACHIEGCTAWHDVHTCQICRTLFTSDQQLQVHTRGVKHLHRVRQNERRLAGLSQPVQCTVCRVPLNSSHIYAQHARGRRHQAALQDQDLENDPGPEELDTPHGTVHCDTCNAYIPFSHWNSHIRLQRHLDAQGYVALKGALEQSEQDKNGIIVSDGKAVIDFGVVDIQSRSIESLRVLSLENTNPTDVILREARMSSVRSASAGDQLSVSLFFLAICRH